MDAQEYADEIEQMGNYNDKDNTDIKGWGQRLEQFDDANMMSDGNEINDILTSMQLANIRDSTDGDFTKLTDFVETAGKDGSSENTVSMKNSHHERLKLRSDEEETNDCEDNVQTRVEKQSAGPVTSQDEASPAHKYNGAILGRITVSKERKVRKCKKKHTPNKRPTEKRKKKSHGCNTKCKNMRNRRRRLHKSRQVMSRSLLKLVIKHLRQIYRRRIEKAIRNNRKKKMLSHLLYSLHHKKCPPYCHNHEHHKRQRYHKKPIHDTEHKTNKKHKYRWK